MEVLEAVFKHEGLRPASISIDDFYLRFEDQQALAQARHSGICCPVPLSVIPMLKTGAVQQAMQATCDLSCRPLLGRRQGDWARTRTEH